MNFSSIKRRCTMYFVNHVFAGTKYFGIKRWLLKRIGYTIGSNTKIVGPVFNTGRLIVGANCWVGRNLTIHGNGVVMIGDNCDVAPDVTFLTGGHRIGGHDRRAGLGEALSDHDRQRCVARRPQHMLRGDFHRGRQRCCRLRVRHR